MNGLKHVIEPIEGNTDESLVLVLDTGAQLTAEDCAMLQALYSRSPDSALAHLDKLAKVGSGKFMGSYYVGYGHKSIGDCGGTTIFIEGVSMLAAKAIQDSMLYNGQECSTRYLDFSTQKFLAPGTANTGRLSQNDNLVLENWRQFYVSSLDKVKAHVAEQFPRQSEEDETIYQKAVNARAFDIMRAFLPAGASTSLSWTTNLRQASDHLKTLLYHPLLEVRRIAEVTKKALAKAHPNSFGHQVNTETAEYYQRWMATSYLYLGSDSHVNGPDEVTVQSHLDWEELEQYRPLLERRPKGAEMPKKLGHLGSVTFECLLDFGSYRDLQRQRAVVQQMPLLSTEFGFEPWYLAQLPDSVRAGALERLGQFENKIMSDLVSRWGLYEAQYFVPMGYQVPCQVTGDLPALVYLVELRAGSMVHPTLRRRAQQMASALMELGSSAGLVLHVDFSEAGRFDSRRGRQDIVSR